MNKRNNKKHKSANISKIKSDNGGTEVFVLPPNLLEKLGIKLGSIQETQQDSLNQEQSKSCAEGTLDNKRESDANNIEESHMEESPDIVKESSILETANLMKASVLLSPTFVPTVANVIPGEVEIINTANTINYNNCYLNNINQEQKSYQYIPKEKKIEIVDPITQVQKDDTVVAIQLNHCNSHFKNDDKLVSNCDGELIADNLEIHSLESKIECEIKKVHSGDNNIEIKENQDHFSKNVNNDNANTGKAKNKIKIISEEIVNGKNISGCWNTCNFPNAFTPLKVDSIISPKHKSFDKIKPVSEDFSNHNLKPISEIRPHYFTKNENEIIPTVSNGAINVNAVQNIFIHNQESISNDFEINSESNEQFLNLKNQPISKPDIFKIVPCDKALEVSKNENNHILVADEGTSDGDLLISLNNNTLPDLNNILLCPPTEDDNGDKLQYDLKNSIDDFEIKSEELSDTLLNKIVTDVKGINKGFLNNIALEERHLDMCDSTGNSFMEHKVIDDKTCEKEKSELIMNIIEIKNKLVKPNGSIKSKTCIQGVEKPGGKTEELKEKSTALKTYPRAKRQSVPTFAPLSKDLSQKCYSDELININIDVTLESNNQTEIYCLCRDFGCLTYYDCSDQYEHIHFTKSANVNCESKLLFSIYSDDLTIETRNIDDFNENESKTNEETLQICWNSIYELDNIDDITSFDTSMNVKDTFAEMDSPNVGGENSGPVNHEKSFEKENEKNNQELDMIDTDANEINTITAMENIVKKEEIAADKNMVVIDIKDRENISQQITPVPKTVAKRRVIDDESRSTLEDGHPPCKKNVKCGVCAQVVANKGWERHASDEHCFIAWKCGSTINLQDEELMSNLKRRLENMGFLKCSLCELETRNVHKHLLHVQQCIDVKSHKDQSSDTGVTPIQDSPTKKVFIKCGVCKREVENIESWHDHIKKDHEYQAWEDGKEPLELTNRDQVREHLHSLSKQLGGLDCHKCGRKLKYAQNYLSHLDKCQGQGHDSSKNDSINVSVTSSDTDHTLEDLNLSVMKVKRDYSIRQSKGYGKPQQSKEETREGETPLGFKGKSLDTEVTSPQKRNIKCGVCNMVVETVESWNKHIMEVHNYLAWEYGTGPLDFDDREQVLLHLHLLSKQLGGLECSKCGRKLKYARKFLGHIEQCHATEPKKPSKNDSIVISQSSVAENTLESNQQTTSDACDSDGSNEKLSIVKEKKDNSISSCIGNNLIKCGVCKIDVDDEQSWLTHIWKEHAYLAWKEGETPLDQNNEEEIRIYLKSISTKLNGLTCRNCNLKRKHVKAYLFHVKACDKLHDDSSVSINSSQADESVLEDSLLDRISRHRRKKSQQSVDPEPEGNSKSDKNTGEDKSQEDQVTKCGVCKEDIQESKWYEHIGMAHNYLAWKDGEPALQFNDEDSKFHYLQSISKTLEGLTCYKCNLKRKYVKLYLCHIKTCTQSIKTESNDVKCGVCSEIVEDHSWEKHIQTAHQYLAWKDGENPIDLKNEQNVLDHLQSISENYNGLICPNCNINRKCARKYLKHVKRCSSKETSNASITNESVDNDRGIKCGVCSKTVKEGLWLKHTQIAHNYMAWKDGEKPVDLSNKKNQWAYLNALLEEVEDFVCAKCGYSRKNAKIYLDHLDICKAEIGEVFEDRRDLLLKNNGLCECAICHQKLKPEDWDKHAFKQHYTLAWIVGEVPLDFTDTYGMEKAIKKYQQLVGKLVCNICGISRSSPIGFFAHIVACGKTEEEIERFKTTCDTCGSKYLGVQKSQHMAAHRERDYAAQREQEQTKMREQLEEEQNTPVTGRRRAAQKAQTVIENYKSETVHDSQTCKACGFSSDNEKRFARHNCAMKEEDFDATAYSDEEADDSGSSGVATDQLDSSGSERSDEESETEIVKDKRDTASASQKPTWVPPKVNITKSFIKETALNFHKEHLSGENLFPHWRSCEYERLTEKECAQYTPHLKQSCNLFLPNMCLTLDRFEGKMLKNKYHCIFVGGSAGRIAWAPAGGRGEGRGRGRARVRGDERGYLAVLGHLTADCPRYSYNELREHPAMIQIWDYGDFKTAPKFVLGLAHDYGTAWDLCWCPSGTRDPLDEDSQVEAPRLGLLAVACSNGNAYIFSVPYPTSIEEDTDKKLMIKLKPVVELRFCSSGSERKMYQATSLSWSKKKGHEIVTVGYADGSIAFYNLNIESPLLRSTENGVTVLYPFRDDRLLNICVSGLDMFPSSSESSDVGAVCGTSVGGSASALSAASRPARALSHVAGASGLFTPCWPTALVSGCEVTINQIANELEWFSTGRRYGGLQAGAACVRRARLATFAQDALCLRPLPLCVDYKKKVIASIQMIPISGKKRKRKNDELSMNLEPLTYEEAVKKYGVQFDTTRTRETVVSTVKEIYPERFPLADVNSMAFNPSLQYHQYLAVALHSGIVIVLSVE